jgi:hypothetical protein
MHYGVQRFGSELIWLWWSGQYRLAFVGVVLWTTHAPLLCHFVCRFGLLGGWVGLVYLQYSCVLSFIVGGDVMWRLSGFLCALGAGYRRLKGGKQAD